MKKLSLFVFLITGFLQAQQLTEILLNPPTATDYPNEYIELQAPINTTLNKIAILAIEGDSATQKGFLDNKYDLNGVVVGSSGYVLIASAGHSYTPSTGTTVVELITTTNLENSNNILLVSYTDPLPNLTTDLDTNDDGVLELPTGMTILDGVSVKGVATDFAYSTNVFDASVLGYTPDLLFRAPNQWQGGDVLGTAPAITIDGTKTTRPDLGGSSVTPGAMNPISTAQATEVPRESAIKVYPNPFQAELYVESTHEIEKVELYDLKGQQILRVQRELPALSHLPNGQYILMIKTNLGTQWQIVVKK